MNKKRMVVKMQTSLAGTRPEGMVLVYNRDKSLIYEGPITVEVSTLMRGRLKAYFFAECKDGVFEIGAEAPWQNW